MRLDRLLALHPKWGRKQAQTMLVKKQVMVDGQIVTDGTQEVTQFSRVEASGEILQEGITAVYLMMNKPPGVLSATTDPVHPTIMDLLPEELSRQLHIGGRLDKASSGLMLLTNDGLWSRRLTAPELKKPKTYRVTTANPMDPDTQRRFAEGIYFPFENMTTRPALLKQLGPKEARLTIYEGRYHQIKRMFGRFRNPVTGLHRESMGLIQLDESLAPGEYRSLTPEEVATI